MASSVSRRLALAFALSCLALLAVAGPAGAASVAASGTVVTYTGDATADALEVRQFLATQLEFDAGAVTVTPGSGCIAVADSGGDSGMNAECTGSWTSIVVNLLAGDDTADLGTVDLVTIASTINGGDGNDTITGGSGNDTIDLGAGTGTGYGSTGNDMMSASPAANENPVLWGNAGDDTLSFAGGAVGSAGVAIAEAGNDTLTGGAGNNAYQGGEGNDTITGGAGNETISGDSGQDTLNAGAGDDMISPGSVISGASIVSDGADVINGGDGVDTVTYAVRSLPLVLDLRATSGQGEAGENDSFTGIEHVAGGNANDTITGDAGANNLSGGAGADTIVGGAGFDQLMGQADADTVVAGDDTSPDLVGCGSTASAASGILPAGSDSDTAVLDYLDILDSLADCETVNRAAPPALAPQLGTRGNDTLLGTSLADLILGLTGNDVVNGRAGNDELHGNRGNDRLLGAAGNDELHGGAGRDALFGGPGSDLLVGGPAADVLDGQAGKDVLLARDGARDVVSCTRVNLPSRLMRLQRDIVFADRIDVIRNRMYCGRIAIA